MNTFMNMNCVICVEYQSNLILHQNAIKKYYFKLRNENGNKHKPEFV